MKNNRNHNGTNNFPLGIVAVFMSILVILVYFDFFLLLILKIIQSSVRYKKEK